MSVCAHCGQETGITYGTVTLHVGVMKLCHTGLEGRPDCYRRVTVYHEPLSILKNVSPLPAGIEDIRVPSATEILKLYNQGLLWYILCMPKTIPKHVQLRTTLRDETREAFQWAQRLESVIAVKSRGSSEVFHGKIDHSQPPWNAPAAGLIMELHAWVRFTERLWRRSAGLPVRPRGGSHQNTWKALEGLYGLSEAVDDSLVAEDTRWLSAWIRRASVVLGETESLKRLPRLPGQREAKCPWCKKNSLRQMALDGVIFCVDMKCVDEEERRPRAQLEYFRGEMVLRWQDRVIGAP